MTTDSISVPLSPGGGEEGAEPGQRDPRRAHYGAFYELDDSSDSVAIVIGNCQAESLRIMLAGPDLETVRIPPVHELTADDMPYLDRLLARARLVVSQPVRDGYHALPVGTREVMARVRPGTLTAVVPAVRHTALYPAHVVVRDHARPVDDPPIVVYHDLRVLAAAAGIDVRLTADAVRAIAAASADELRRREQRHDTVRVSDLFDSPRFEMMRTMNHPGNAVFAPLAARVREAVGLEAHSVDPGRPLLDSVHAPRDPVVIAAWGLDDEHTDHWVVAGRQVALETVERAHREWYREHPQTLAFAVERHADTIRVLRA